MLIVLLLSEREVLNFLIRRCIYTFLLQKCAARIILDAAPDAPSQPLFTELNLSNFYERIEYNKGILMFKILHGLAPSYLRNLFTF